jgi:hypothetical protein
LFVAWLIHPSPIFMFSGRRPQESAIVLQRLAWRVFGRRIALIRATFIDEVNPGFAGCLRPYAAPCPVFKKI